jgi:hypothetical protein
MNVKTTLFLPFVLISSTIVIPIPVTPLARQGRIAVLSSLDMIGKSVDNTLREVKYGDGIAKSITRIVSATDTVKININKATTGINATPPIDIIEVVAIIWTAQTLDGKIQQMMDAFMAQKGGFMHAGSEKQAREGLKELYIVAGVLKKSIVNRM